MKRRDFFKRLALLPTSFLLIKSSMESERKKNLAIWESLGKAAERTRKLDNSSPFNEFHGSRWWTSLPPNNTIITNITE